MDSSTLPIKWKVTTFTALSHPVTDLQTVLFWPAWFICVPGSLVKAVWHGCRGSPAFVSRGYDWQSLDLRGPCSQVLTCFGRAWFIARHLKCPVLGKCWRSPKNFWSHWAMVLRPAPHVKKALSYTVVWLDAKQILLSQPDISRNWGNKVCTGIYYGRIFVHSCTVKNDLQVSILFWINSIYWVCTEIKWYVLYQYQVLTSTKLN